MKHVSTNSLSTSIFSSFCVAFATADFGLFVNFNVINASLTFFPRIKSTASRAFCGDMRMNLLVALLIMLNPLSVLPELRHLRHRPADRRGQRLCPSNPQHYGL